MNEKINHNRCLNTGIKRAKPFISLEEGIVLRKKVNEFIDTKIEEWNNSVPFAKHFQDGGVNREYYLRHLIETVWRIRLLRIVESKAIGEIAKTSPEAARIWANYENEEMIHDKMFLKDLVRAGVDISVAYETEPYLSTKLLSGFFNYLLEHEGPLGVIVYSYLVEYVNVKLDPDKIKGLTNSFGSKKIRGQIAHNKTDNNEDHPGEVWNVVRLLIRNDNDVKSVYQYINEHQCILAMYFKELYQEKIVEQKTSLQSQEIWKELPPLTKRQNAMGCIQ